MSATSDIRLEGQREALKMMGLGDVDLGLPEKKTAPLVDEVEDDIKENIFETKAGSFESTQ